MKIMLATNTRIPVHAYGGTERIVWWLGKHLVAAGHDVVYLAKRGSECPFAQVIVYDEKKSLAQQIPPDVDLVHFHFHPEESLEQPMVVTYHENAQKATTFHRNTIFLSYDHALRHGGEVFVYNGIDLEAYGKPMLHNKRLYLHFLGNAAWRVKNVRGAIDVASQAGENLHVIGGTRVNFRAGLRITLNPRVRFHGMLGGMGKHAVINNSKGLIFPVIWHEPFGLGIIESMYFGCPVFGTPYGSLPELLGRKPNLLEKKSWNGAIDGYFSELGCLCVKKSELVEAVKNAESFNRHHCHEYVCAYFSAQRMTQDYLKCYEQVLAGKDLHVEPPALVSPPVKGFLPFD